MNAEAGPSSRVKRMLPSVSEVLKELTSRASVEPDVAFRAAREVCAEELKRIRDAGGDSVPLEELVQRAYRRVTGQTLPGLAAPPAPAPEPAPVFEAAGDDPFAVVPPPGAPARGADEPFLETSGALDLKWDEGREPFAGATAPGPATAPPLLFDEPTRPEGLVLPGSEAGIPPPAESLPVPFALPDDDAPYAAAAGPAVFPPATVEEGGPGDETLSRLSREAEAIDLQEVFPRPGAGAPPAYPEPADALPASRAVATPPPFEDDEDTVLTVPRGGRKGESRPRAGLVVGVVAAVAALVGLGYLLVGLWMERDAAPMPVAVARPRTKGPAPAPVPSAAVPSPMAAAPAGAPAAAEPEPTAPAPTPFPVATRAAAPPAVVPSPALKAPGEAAPPPPAPVFAATPAVAAVPRSRDGLVVTRDRAGQPQVFSIHFTSYRDRASAERDLKRVEAMAGMKGFVAEVDLGEKGVWQRVMIGAFPTASEAKAVREGLAAKGTRDMGWVYRVVGPEGAGER